MDTGVRASITSGAGTESIKLLHAECCCLCPQNAYTEALTPTVMVFGGGVLGEVIGFKSDCEGRTLTVGLVSL